MRSSTRHFSGVAAALAAVVVLGVLATAQGTASKSLPNANSSNFMPFGQITKQNVSQLQMAWFYPYGGPTFSPIFVRDVLYGYGRNASLIALDAATGKEIWIHEGLNGMTSKGINYWESEDGSDRRLIFSVSSFLQEIDARTGKTIPTFGIDGVVDLRKGLLRAEGTSVGAQPTSPGRIWKNTMIFGGQSGEQIMTPPGDPRAYDVITGKLLWQFNTIPQPGQYGYETNPPDGWKYIGGANNWGEMALDEERGIVYIPTGSATADFWGGDRHGQNLFANCLIALDVRTGRRLWHFQTIHHDLWDLDNVSAPQLVSVTHDGKKVDVVAHAGKTGFLYVFNRVTGEPLWPIEERPVGKSTVPYELSWPTQPFPTKPPAFGRQSFTMDDVNPWLLTPEEYEAIRRRVMLANNGPGPQGGIFVPTILNGDAISMPGNQGGSNWGTTAADPKRGLVFVTGVEEVALLRVNDIQDPTAGGLRTGGAGAVGQFASAEVQQGQRAYQLYCAPCHGMNQMGAMPGVLPLVGVTQRMDVEALRTIVNEGRNNMRPILDVTTQDAAAIYAYLAATVPVGRRGGGGARGRGFGPAGLPLPPGPVVASGGAPRPPVPEPYSGPLFPGQGGTTGNRPWPADTEAAKLQVRYQSGYNVMGAATKPPYTRITAYDLNTGEIRWQVTNGDDPATVQRGGPRGTGGVGARYGMVVTDTGLLFQIGKDGFARAFDVDNGRVLWTGKVAGPSRGMPAMYMSKGRQYIVFMSPNDAGGFGGGRGAAPGAAAAAPPAEPEGPCGSGPGAQGPCGYIAFALPQK